MDPVGAVPVGAVPPKLVPVRHSSVTSSPRHQRLAGRASDPQRGRSPSRRLAEFGDRQRSRSRNYDIFLPKSSHIHTPKREDTCSNPDKITRFTSPTRTLHRTDSGAQNYRTSLSAVLHSREELNCSSTSSDNVSSDAISCYSDSPFRKRMDVTYMSLPHGPKSTERFRSIDVKTAQILREYHAERNRFRLELYDISTGIQRRRVDVDAGDLNGDRTPTDHLNGHARTPDTPKVVGHVTFPNHSPLTPSAPQTSTPVIKASVSDVNGNGGPPRDQLSRDQPPRDQPYRAMENGGIQTGGKAVITAEYFCVKRVNYDELKQRFADAGNREPETEEAMRKLNMVNGDPSSPSKKSLASSISNFFRKMSPRLQRKSRGSERSSTSSIVDGDELTSGAVSPVHKSNKSPLASPIRRLMNGKKRPETHKTEPESGQNAVARPEAGEASGRVVTVPLTLDVHEPTVKASLPKRGLLTARSADSIGECSLDVNMMGSEPSIASGPQSGSASKRTLHSHGDTRHCLPTRNHPSPTQPASFSHPELNSLANGSSAEPHSDNKNLSYVALSVSVSGYPKYRPFKSPTKQDDKAVEVAGDVEEADLRRNTNNSCIDDVFLHNNSAPNRTNASGPSAPHVTSAPHGTSAPHVTVRPGVASDAEYIGRGGMKPKVNLHHVDGDVFVSDRGDGVKDARYYLTVVDTETAKILHLVKIAEPDLAKPGKTEEVYGKLRAAIGKATLLVTQKFQQFKGLCESNINPPSDGSNPVTTCQDLAGFWDLVSLQVDEVYTTFHELQQLRDNGWREIPAPPSSQHSDQNGAFTEHKRTPKKALNSAPHAAGAKSKAKIAADKTREEARKRLMEAKKLARRKRLTSGSSADDVEIFVTEPVPEHCTGGAT